jgi:hypothetical protein
VYCISRYLECPIHVWNKNNGQIMEKIGNQYGITILNITYGIIIAKKPTNKCNNVIDVLTISKNDTYNKIVGNVKLNKSENNLFIF